MGMEFSRRFSSLSNAFVFFAWMMVAVGCGSGNGTSDRLPPPNGGDSGDNRGQEPPVEPTPNEEPTGPCAANSGALDTRVWSVKEIKQFEVLSRSTTAGGRPVDANPKTFSNFANRRLCALGSTAKQCLPNGPLADLTASGTFSDGGLTVFGASVRRGVDDRVINSNSKVYGRGGVAQLDDGSIVVCRPGENGQPQSLTSLNHVCGRAKAQVFEFLGGGGLLIHRGWKACSNGGTNCDASADLYTVQRFDQGGAGINSDQMRGTQHTIIATRKGRAYLVWPVGAKTGKQIQTDFCAAGFDGVLKLDGGSGFYARGRNGLSVGSGNNPSGFLIKLK